MGNSIDIAVCGNITIDYIIDKKHTLFPPLLGGNAIYTAISAALWGYKTGIVSKVGCDFPFSYFDNFVSLEIDITGVAKQKTLHESISGIQYYENDERRYFNVNKSLVRSDPQKISIQNIEEKINGESMPEALPEFDPEPSNIPEYYYQAAGVNLCSMVGHSQYKLARAFQEHGNSLRICDGSDEEKDPISLEQLLSGMDYFIPSEAEVSYILGDTTPRQAVDFFLEKGPGLKAVIIKLGQKGAFGYDRQKDKYFQLPVYPWTNVIDTTGAGDSFCGGFIAGILETDDVIEAAKRAAVTSSIMIEGYSTNSITNITKKTLEERLNRYSRFISE